MARQKIAISDLRGSRSFLELNPGLSGGKKTLIPAPASPATGSKGKNRVRTAPRPKTRPEIDMASILEARLRSGEVKSYGFESLTLSIGDGTRYTPDFFTHLHTGEIQLIETKGPFIREDSLIKFKVAKKIYPCFDFQLWQLTKSGWERLI